MSKNKLPNAFNVQQLNKLFESINRPKVAIAAFLTFYCGLRIEEVCSLRIQDIDLVNRKLKIVDSKNPNRSITGYGKDRYVPIPRKVLSPLKKWLDIVGHDSKWFLPSMLSPDKHLRKKSLYEQYRQALDKAGLLIPDFEYKETKGPRKGLKKVKHLYYFHTLRHSYATYLLSKGVDIYTISNLMGHNQVTTTQIYAKVNTTQSREAVEDAFSGPLMEFRPNYKQNIAQPIQQMQQPQTNHNMELLRLEVERNKIELEKMKLLKLHMKEQEGKVRVYETAIV